ncbi:MAG: hypothetical protein V4634_12915 [Pseudomonadota bacterium]
MNNPGTPAATEMLPVGMMGNMEAGSPAAQALESIAIRKHGLADWQPFHYEKISAADYEVTGGVAQVLTGGQKKWPEPHTSVIVTAEEIAAEMNLLSPVAPAEAEPASSEAAVSSTVSNSSPKYMTVVLQLPPDQEGRSRLTDAFSPGKQFFGAIVAATSMENEIAVSQSLAEHCSEKDIALARQSGR